MAYRYPEIRVIGRYSPAQASLQQVDADLESALVAAMYRGDADPLLITDARTGPAGDGVVWANDACRALLGYPEDAPAPIVPADHYPEATRAALEQRLPAARAGQRIRGCSTFLRRDGSPFCADWTLTPLMDAGGNIRWWLTSLRDASEQQQLDALIAGERATVLATRARARLSEVIAGGAHDFNNALTVIQNMTTMVMEDLGEDTAVAEDLEAVQAAAADAGELARSLTAFGRRGARDARSTSAFDFDLVVGQIVRVLRRAVPKRIEIDIDLACGEIIESSESMLQQVLQQLLLDAGAAIPELGRIRIATRASSNELCETETQLTVSSELPEGQALAGSMTDATDAGDAVVRTSMLRLLQQHGGRLSSAVTAAGRAVTLTLPAKATQAPGASDPRQALIVETDTLAAADLERALTDQGFRCVRAESDGTAPAADLAGTPELIIVALALGRDNGIEVAGRLAERYPGAALVLTTHGMLPESAEPPSPFRHVLRKPFAGSDIETMISAVSPP